MFLPGEHSRATTIPVVIFKASTEGFEPPTNKLEVCGSIQLSYVPISYRGIRCDITQGNTRDLISIILCIKQKQRLVLSSHQTHQGHHPEYQVEGCNNLHNLRQDKKQRFRNRRDEQKH